MRRKSDTLKLRAFNWDVKAVDEVGRFSGYGSVFGVVDSYGEVVAPGAFATSLAELNAKGRSLPALWQHRGAEPIGNWDMATLKEDAHGLHGEGVLWLEEAPYARIAHRGMKARAITGLSIGYYERDSARDDKTGIRTLKQLELVEISIVTSPANDEARLDQVKAKVAHGSLPTLREFEELLREQGFSKSRATMIASHGLKSLLSRGEPDGENAAIASALAGFQLPNY
jgi:HK97 family phage prohead protease